MPTEFEVNLDGPTISLLKAIRVLADRSVNLDTVSISQSSHGYMVRFLTGSEEEVRRSLMMADLRYKENKVLVVEVPNSPGQWLRVAQMLAENGVEVSHTYRVGQTGEKHLYVIGVNDYPKAEEACSRLGLCKGEGAATE